MKTKSGDLSRSDWVIMEALWERGRATATDLQQMLVAEQGWAYSTVKTMLDRMVDKGLVRARRVGNVYEYSPKVRRKSIVGRVIDDVFERVLEGSVTPFIDRLVQGRKLPKEEIDALKEMLDKYSESD